MNQSLRQRHRHIWIVGGAVIPLGFILVLVNIPNPKPGSLVLESEVVNASWTSVIQSKRISVSQVRHNQTKTQIKIELGSPWKSPFVTVYENSIEGSPLGKIEGIGDYYFETHSNPSQLVFYDEIKETIVLTVQLK